MISKRYSTKHPVVSWFFSHKIVTVQGEYGMSFCCPGTNSIEHYECRDTNLIGAVSLSPVTKLVAGTGAVSRYNSDRSQKTVKVYWISIAGRCACPGATTITNLS